MKTTRAWRWWMIDMIGLGCCAALTGAGYVIAVVPVAQSSAAVAKLHSEIDAAQSRADQLLELTRKADASLARILSRLDSSSLSLEPAERVNRRVNELTRLASESGLKVDELQPGVPEAGALYRIVPIQMSGTGSYPDCAMFLHRLRHELRDTTVRSLRVVATGGDGTTSTIVFDLVWYAAPSDRAG